MKDDELFGKLVRSTKQRRREETNINYERSLVLGQLLIKEEYVLFEEHAVVKNSKKKKVFC